MSTTSQYTIRHLAKGEDIEPVISVLNEAFRQDEFSNLISYHNNELLEQIQRSQVIAASIAGEIYVAQDINKTVVGAAVWFEPGRTLFDSDDQRASALLPMITKFPPELQNWWKEELFPAYKQLASLSGESAILDSWHLQSIGIIPEHQGKGIAKVLIQEVQAKANATGVAMSLETTTTKNLAIYEHLGFKVKGRVTVSNIHGTSPMLAMLREPNVVSTAHS